MWKRLALMLALWAWIPLCWQPLWGQAPGVGKDEASKPKQLTGGKADTAQNAKRGTQEIPFVADTQGHKQTQEETDRAQADKDHQNFVERRTLLFAGAGAVATVVLMFVGIAGVCAALHTLRAIKRQTEALIRSQRAWILIDSIEEPPLSDGIDRPEMFSALAGVPLLVFNLKTVGATTVKLIGSGARFHLAPRKEGADPPEPALPDQPDYKIGPGILPEAGFVKAPNEGMQIAKELEDGPLLPEQLAAIHEKKLFLCAYGFVSYEDSFKDRHETRFCYVYRVSYRSGFNTATGKDIYRSRFSLGGPEAYNGYRDQTKNPN